MDTFDEAVRQEPDAHPLVHSDRGFQYTSAQFYTRLKKRKRLNFRHGYKNPRPHFCNRSTLIIHI